MTWDDAKKAINSLSSFLKGQNLRNVLKAVAAQVDSASDTSVEANPDSGLAAAANLQELAEALSARIKDLEDAQ